MNMNGKEVVLVATVHERSENATVADRRYIFS